VDELVHRLHGRTPYQSSTTIPGELTFVLPWGAGHHLFKGARE
jgi:hypothetical protein